ncbi:MAG: cystathionine beta-lyase [Rubritalea sp.]|jgi:cystathionine beta-lyase
MNFDTIIPRHGTGSIKWDRRPELDPFWVADMDFVSPQCVLDAVQARVDHGVFGYANAHDGLTEALTHYLSTRHKATVNAEHIIHLGGLVVALSLITRAFVSAGESVMTCTPVYPPFLGVANDAGAETIQVPHVITDGKYSFDWEAMEAAVTSKTKIFILCNPQNPLGRSFTKAEVTQVAVFCEKHDLVLVSDEVHCDLVFNEEVQPFFSTINLPENLKQKLIVLQAPSKTYNVAGLGYAFAIIENDSVRRKFNQIKGHTLPEINCIAFYTAEAAYRHGEPWRQELLAYLKKNRDTITDFIRNETPYLSIPDIEATYLAWIDCSKLGLENPAVYLEKDAGLFLSDGTYFSSPQHIRFNFGCPHERVLEGLEKIKTSFDKIDIVT